MDVSQSKIDVFQKNSGYIIASLIFFILSLIGLFAFSKINRKKNIIPPVVLEPTKTPEVSPIPTLSEIIPSPEVNIPTVVETSSVSIIPTVFSTPAPTLKPSPTKKPTPTPKPTSTPRPTLAPKPTIPVVMVKYENNEDKFSLNYASYRKVYKEKEGNGNLYTFYSVKGSFAIHVSYGDWIWVNSERSFNNDFTINNLPTFRYDTDSQTLVDVENAGKKYTIQCVHNNISSLKSECEDFIKSFQVL